MDTTIAGMTVLWLVWAGVLVSYRLNYRRLSRLLAGIDAYAWKAIQFRQGTLDPLEPFRWYFRVRRFIFGSAALPSNVPEVSSLVTRLWKLDRAAEITGAVLLAITLLSGLALVLGQDVFRWVR